MLTNYHLSNFCFTNRIIRSIGLAIRISKIFTCNIDFVFSWQVIIELPTLLNEKLKINKMKNSICGYCKIALLGMTGLSIISLAIINVIF